MNAVLGLLPLLCRSSARCSPSTFLHLPYRKLCRMSEVITSDSERLGHLNPDFRAKASAGSTEPMLQDALKKIIIRESKKPPETTSECSCNKRRREGEDVDTHGAALQSAPLLQTVRVKLPCLVVGVSLYKWLV